jgi:hypothetical protein
MSKKSRGSFNLFEHKISGREGGTYERGDSSDYSKVWTFNLHYLVFSLSLGLFPLF